MAFVEAYSKWTANANGAGFEPQAEVNNRVDEWNSIFYRLLAHAFVRLTLVAAAAEVARRCRSRRVLLRHRC